MNSNPSFYPKHLARQYVHHRGWKEPDEAEELQVPPPASLHVPKINGQRSVTPVGNVNPAAVNMTSNSTESSPSSSMNSTELSISSRDGSRSNRKILEGLPDTFITAMKQLFCLLDVEGCGQVHIEDIAENWSPDGAGAVLPPNIVPSLKKVTTPDGYLTFERYKPIVYSYIPSVNPTNFFFRFCAGLKIAILRHSAQRHRQIDSSEVRPRELSLKVDFNDFNCRKTVIIVRMLLLRQFHEQVVCQICWTALSLMEKKKMEIIR